MSFEHDSPRRSGAQPAEGGEAARQPGRRTLTGAIVQRKPKDKLPSGQQGFDQMWDAHPHNYQDDESENTSSEDVREEHGLPDYMDNTCAIRVSVMLNDMGLTITPEKTKAAGIKRKPHFSQKTKKYYILAASEMWEYIGKNFRPADAIYPASGKWKSAEEFQTEFDKTVKPIVSERKGLVGFDKIFGYAGTGHVDIFDGEKLSNAASWYACNRLHLWYVVVP